MGRLDAAGLAPTSMTPAESAPQIDFEAATIAEPTPAKEGRGLATVAQLFRAAKKALTQRDGDNPPAKSRRRTEDTGRAAFAATAKKIITRRLAWLPRRVYRKAAGKTTGRTATTPAADTGAAAGFLSDIVDWLNLWQDGEAFDPANSDWDLGDESSGGESWYEADIAGGELDDRLNYDLSNHLSPHL